MSKKQLVFMALFAVAGLNLAACTTQQERAESLPEGSYKKSVTYTDSSGATVTSQSETDVDVNDEGRKKIVKKSKTTRDPQGLFNKETTSQSKTVIDEQ